MEWNSNLYDNAQSYVSEYGKELLSYIPNDNEQNILDLGCGTGDLSQYIYNNISHNIIGIDSSNEMIDKAHIKYPQLNLKVCDACNIPYVDKFDVVFSNAVFHWINNQKQLHNSIFNSLKKDGLLICEFGAKNNISKIITAYNNAINKFNDTYNNPFYFPTIEEHTKVLCESKFNILKIELFKRPTKLSNNFSGLKEFIKQFFSDSLKKYNEKERDFIYNSVEKELKDNMYNGENWIADYYRIRVIAKK